MNSIHIRPAIRSDLPALIRLYGQLSVHNGAELSPSHLAAWEDMQAQPNVTVLVAELNGMVVGTLQLTLVVGLTHGGKPFGVVESVVVNEEARGQGVALALLVDAEARAKQANAYKLMLQTSPNRAAAVALYRSAGFENETKMAFQKRF